MTDPATLRRAYEADSWPRPQPGAPQLLIWRFRFHGNELEGWRAHRVQQAELPGPVSAVLSVWLPAAEPSGALLAINVSETASAADAREFLLRQLGEFQGPRLSRVEGIGEVAFGIGRLSVLFLRANLVVQVGSVERVEVPADGIARRLDQWIADTPATAPEGKSLLRVARDPSGKGLRVSLQQPEPATGGPWFKFRVRGGAARAEPEGVVIIPDTMTVPDVEAFIVDQAGNTSRNVLKLP